ncbi:hypothetical protein DNTS_031821, partial [Danionella cerebrum]
EGDIASHMWMKETFVSGLIMSAGRSGSIRSDDPLLMTKTALSSDRNMEDLRTTQSSLTGETFTRRTVVNLAIGGLTFLWVLITVISSFVFPTPPPTELNIFFVICIVMIGSSVMVLIFWYQQGDLDPKFNVLIYYSIGIVNLLCLCANLYFHDVGR